MNWPRPKIQVGFTLVEILVALLILGIMSALGFGTYRAARISAERTEESLQRTREVEFGMRVILQDFSELAPRPVRDPLGQTATANLPALRASSGAGQSSGVSGQSSGFAGQSSGIGSSSTSMMELTRAGWSNTAGQQRSTLQRVSYALVGEILKRGYQTNLDTTNANKPVIQDLLTGVKSVQLRFLDQNLAWQNQWPPAALPLPDSLWTRPIAAEIVVEFKDWGKVRRLIEVAG
jgi:general secretion pathway protein J